MLTLAACRSCDSRKSLPSVLYGPVDNFFSPRSGAAGTRRSPCRRDVPALAAQAAQERSAGSRGYPKHQSAPPRRSCSGRPATASRGGVPLPARGWLDALGSSSAPELRMIPGPPPAINGKHMTTTVASRHAKSGVETPSRARAHTGESGATPGAAFTTSPCHFPFHQPSRPCRASEDARRHRAGGRQEPAALLHHRCQTSVASSRSAEVEQPRSPASPGRASEDRGHGSRLRVASPESAAPAGPAPDEI